MEDSWSNGATGLRVMAIIIMIAAGIILIHTVYMGFATNQWMQSLEGLIVFVCALCAYFGMMALATCADAADEYIKSKNAARGESESLAQ